MTEPPTLPLPIRAAAGLVARALDDVRQLPTRLLSLPVLAAGTAMQVSLRVQQEYAALIARGDEVLLQLRGPNDDIPAWATFDSDDDPAAGTAAHGRAAVLPGGSGPEVAEPVPAAAPKPARKPRSRPAPMGAAPSAFDLVADPEVAAGSMFGEPEPPAVKPPAERTD